MSYIHDSLADIIGRTPLLRLKRINKTAAHLIIKLEYMNPGGSTKDRAALAMISTAELQGQINPNETVLIEPTSGNTGIGLAMVAAAKGYRLILTMPETMSIERRKLLQGFGAKVVLTPGIEGMRGAIIKAEQLGATIPHSFILQQFKNPANVEIHRLTTAQEIWSDTDGGVDVIVMGVGTGGTLTGVGSIIKARKPDVKIVAVEPQASPVLSGGKAAPHKLQGIGPGFIPEILDTNLIDEVIAVGHDEAIETARNLAKTEGLMVGISSGAAAWAALQIAARPESADKMIVFIAPSNGERYLSTSLFDHVT
jgi:cysteine synthase A